MTETQVAAGASPVTSEPKTRFAAKPPFQLCFAAEQQLGRSELSRPKLPGQISIVTPKFYSKCNTECTENDMMVQQLAQQIEKLGRQGPKEIHEEPVLESHRYGWYAEPLMPVDKSDRRFNHHKHTSEMVKIQSILHNASRADKQFEQSISRTNNQTL